MTNSSRAYRLSLVTLLFIGMMQILYVYISVQYIWIFYLFVRQSVVFLLLGLSFFFLGRDRRPIKRAFLSNVTTGISLMLFVGVMVIISILFGGGTNAMVGNWNAFVYAFRTEVVLVFGFEMLRFQLIRFTEKSCQFSVATYLTLAYLILMATDLRVVLESPTPDWAYFFFGTVVYYFMVSVLVSLIAIMGGTQRSAITMGLVLGLFGAASPYVPNIQRLSLHLIISGLAFVMGILYYFLLFDSKAQAIEQRRSKLDRPAYGSYVVLAAILGGIIAFGLRIFPIYPVAILTHSMTGTLNQGALVFIQSVPVEEVFSRVGEGEVIHFNMGPIEYIHRVIDFAMDSAGQRVYLTQGDANDLPDPWQLAQDDVLGIVIGYIPHLGWPMVLLYFIFNM